MQLPGRVTWPALATVCPVVRLPSFSHQASRSMVTVAIEARSLGASMPSPVALEKGTRSLREILYSHMRSFRKVSPVLLIERRLELRRSGPCARGDAGALCWAASIHTASSLYNSGAGTGNIHFALQALQLHATPANPSAHTIVRHAIWEISAQIPLRFRSNSSEGARRLPAIKIESPWRSIAGLPLVGRHRVPLSKTWRTHSYPPNRADAAASVQCPGSPVSSSSS